MFNKCCRVFVNETGVYILTLCNAYATLGIMFFLRGYRLVCVVVFVHEVEVHQLTLRNVFAQMRVLACVVGLVRDVGVHI